MKKNKSILKGILITLLILVLILVLALGFTYKHYSSKVNRIEIDRSDVINVGNNSEEEKESPKEEEKVITIALLGADYSNGNGASDSTMILSIDTEKNKIKLCSLMRDIYLDLPDGGQSNLNYTLNYGGPATTLKTINYNFNLKIDKFVMVNLETLPKIIDKLGGVEIDVTEEEVPLINGIIKSLDTNNGTSTSPVAYAGLQTLNGTQATAYARIRSTSGRDYKRTERQRDVLASIFNKFKNITISDVPGLINDLLPLVSTNMSDLEMLNIASKTLPMGIGHIEQARFPSDENLEMILTDMYHMIIDKEATTTEIHNFIYSLE